jgi:hypothetical protein
MAISVDDTTVARWSADVALGGTTLSGSFTPPNGSLLVVCINVDEQAGANTGVPTGGGWTYTLGVARGDAEGGRGYAAIYTAPVTTGASMQVTITRGGTDAGAVQVSAKVYIVTGQNASPIGANNEAGWTTDPQDLSITATGAGRLFGCGTDWGASGAPTSTDTEDSATFPGEISVASVYKAADHSSGSQSINFNPGAAPPEGNLVVLEILAAAADAAPTYRTPRVGVIQLLASDEDDGHFNDLDVRNWFRQRVFA